MQRFIAASTILSLALTLPTANDYAQHRDNLDVQNDAANIAELPTADPQTTAFPDLERFIFEQYSHPPLTDDQILAILVGSWASKTLLYRNYLNKK